MPSWNRSPLPFYFSHVVSIYSAVTYTGVDQSGIANNLAYISSDLSFWTLDFSLFDMLEVNVCHSSVVADAGNTNACPGDGMYDFSVGYKLPSAGSEQTSWLASGWEGSGTITMYAQPNVSMKIGACILDLQTYVTPASGKEKSLLNIPSAAVAAGIVLGALLVLALLFLYCYCCCCKKGAQKAKTVPPTTPTTETQPSFFQRMDDDKSTSGRSILSSSKSYAGPIPSSPKSAGRSVVSEM
jgi:hypothetical protein